jgi:tetratricopeptide (TPR) repeat protein
VFESVETLRRHSFFRASADTAQEPRFLMLESVREYAAERLRETEDQGEAVRMRHAERSLQQARTHLARLRTAGELAALKALEAGAGNLRAAAQWAREKGVAPPGSELALALGQWLQRRGFVQEAVAAIQIGLDLLPPDAPAALRAELLRERAGLHLDFGETVPARERAEEAKALSAALGDGVRQAKAENLLGQAAMQEWNYPEARERFARALEQFEKAQQSIEIAIVQNNLGLMERRDQSGGQMERKARLHRAEAHLQEALRLRRALEDRRGLAETLNNLGVLAFERGEMERAKRFYREALACEQELRNTFGVARSLLNLGEVAQEQNKALRAARLFFASEQFLVEAQSPLQAAVAEMARKAAEDAGLGTDAAAALRAEARRLPAAGRIAFALDTLPASKV